MSHEFKVGDRIRVVVADLSNYAFSGRIPGSHKGYVGTVFEECDEFGSVGITLDGIVYSEERYLGEPIQQWVEPTDIEPLVLTKQEVFELVAHHAVFTLKGERAVDDVRKTCEYESEDGKQCFVGALIADVRDRRKATGSVVNNATLLKRSGVIISDDYGLTDIGTMLKEFQQLHDGGTLEWKAGEEQQAYLALTPGRRLYQWKRTLRRYAARHGLIAPDYLGKESPKKPKAVAQA